MYKGFKSYRHFLNSRLHAYSHIICGDDSVLHNEVWNIITARKIELPLINPQKPDSVLNLTDDEAKTLYITLRTVAQKVYKNMSQINQIIGGQMTQKQKNCIIKICKYKFNWTAEATFSYILETLPHKRKRLTPFEIQKCKLGRLYSIMGREDADKVIKRLDKIREKNENSAPAPPISDSTAELNKNMSLRASV